MRSGDFMADDSAQVSLTNDAAISSKEKFNNAEIFVSATARCGAIEPGCNCVSFAGVETG